MNLMLPPDIRRFIDDEVRAGRYATPEAVVQAAIANMRDGSDAELDDATIAAINEGEDQGDRGEGIELSTFRKQWEKRLNDGK